MLNGTAVRLLPVHVVGGYVGNQIVSDLGVVGVQVLKEMENGYELVYPMTVDVVLSNGGKLNVKDGVELTDTYSTAFVGNSDGTVAVNKDLTDKFIPMEGFAACVNANGELVILSSGAADITSSAELVSYDFDLSAGHLVFDFYCYFAEDTEDASKGFLNNNNAKIRFICGNNVQEFIPADGEEVEDGIYHFTVNFMAKDFQEKVKVQFTDGEYTWYGTGSGMTTYPWQTTIGAKGISVREYLEGVIAFVDMMEEEFQKVYALMDEYYEVNAGLPEEERAEPPISEEELDEYAKLYVYLSEYASVAEATLKYCEAAATQFGVEVIEKAEAINPGITYDLRGPSVPVEDDWTAVTAETLAPYKAVIAEDSVMPKGIKLLGITLVLESYTNIRMYFVVEEGYNINDYTFTLNGEVVRLSANKKSGQTYLHISGLSASQLKDWFTVSVSDGVDTFSFEYCAMSYAYTVMQDARSADTLKDLARAMWVYATRTEEFLLIMDEMNGGM